MYSSVESVVVSMPAAVYDGLSGRLSSAEEAVLLVITYNLLHVTVERERGNGRAISRSVNVYLKGVFDWSKNRGRSTCCVTHDCDGFRF